MLSNFAKYGLCFGEMPTQHARSIARCVVDLQITHKLCSLRFGKMENKSYYFDTIKAKKDRENNKTNKNGRQNKSDLTFIQTS